MKKITYSLFLLLLLLTSESMAQGFKVSGTKLLDANQNEFVMRGINVPVVWYYNQSLSNLENIRNNTKSNSIRIVWDLNNGYSDAQWQAVIQKCIDLKMIPMFELHDATCKNTEADLLRLAQWYASKAEYFKRPEIAKYILINVANEWGDWFMNGETWRNSYLKAIKIIRDSGINTALIIDGPDCGKNMEVVRWYGDDLLFADTQKNLVFGIHFYCRYTSSTEIETQLTAIHNAGLAVFAGEFGAEHPNGSGGNCDIPEKEIMRICQQKRIGYMPWSWIGNNAETKMLDMSFDWAGTSLTGWGNTAVNDVNGIKNTSQVCSIFNIPSNPNNNLAFGKAVTVSSVEATSTNLAALAVDGNTATRWSSLYADPQWIAVDLGATYAISKVTLAWEVAYASAYKIEVSNDGANWVSIYQTSTGNGGLDELLISGTGRYVRMYGTQRATTWGYSLYEFEVYGQKVTVNLAPKANAGVDQTKTDTDNNGTESIQLTGAASTDADGTIASYAWSLNGTPIASGVSPSITLPVGTYQITLEVTDNGGLKATDVVTIVVNVGQVVNSSNLALAKPVSVSSTEANSALTANLAVDGSVNTRWSSSYSDPQWIMVDLQGNYSIQRVVLKWEAAYGKAYRIELSSDATNWTSIYQTTTSDGATDDLNNLAGTGRYVRMYGTTRATQWGYSLYEFEVYGTAAAFSGNFEAETGILTGVSTATNLAGYSGAGFVTGFDNAGDKVRINFSVPKASTYNLTIRNASPFGPKKNFVSVNGGALVEIDFPTSATWQNTLVNSISLNRGANYIEISNSWGWFYVDRISLDEVVPVAALAVVQPNSLSVLNYPNPAAESMTLEMSGGAETSGTIILSRLDGIVLITDSFSNNTYQLNLTTVPDGLYLLTVVTASTSLTKTISVKK